MSDALAERRTAGALWGHAVPVGLCTVVAAGLTLHALGRRPLLDAESRYALVAYEMLGSGDWVQPHLNTFPYYEKPPLLYWAIALSYRVFGVDELAARLPSALAHVATTLLVFALARVLLGRGAALFAGLIYATAVGPLTYARFSFPDGLLVFWLTLALLGLALTVRGKAGWALLYLGAAGAGLSKGFIGLVLPFAAATAYVLVTRDVKIVARLHPGGGALILLGLFLPWHVVLAVRDPAFVHFYVFNEHIYRFLNVREPIDYVPLSLAGFWASTVFWLLPWSLFLPGALLWSRTAPARLTLPLLWSALVIGFFSLARSRLERYGLPALPALVVVIAGYWQALAERPRRTAALTVPALLVAVLGLAMILVTVLAPPTGGTFTGLVAMLDGHYREHPDQARLFVAGAARLARPVSVLLLVFGVSAYLAARAGRGRLGFLLWVAFLVPALLFVHRATELLGSDRSQRDAAEIITRQWEDGARVVVGGLYDDAMSVTFYTRRPTYIVDRQSTDLAFGFRHAVASPLLLTPAQFDEVWRSPGRVFLLTDRRPLPADAHLLLDRPTYTLVTNRPLAASTSRPRRSSSVGPFRGRAHAARAAGAADVTAPATMLDSTSPLTARPA